MNFYPNVGQGSVWLAYFIYAGALACFLVAMEVWHQTNMRKAIREEKRQGGISGRSAGEPANAAGDNTPEPNKVTHDDRNDGQESKGRTAYRPIRRRGHSVAQERIRKQFTSGEGTSISNKLNPNLHASSRRGPMTLDDVVAAAAYRQLLLDRVVEILSESHRMDEEDEGVGGSERTARRHKEQTRGRSISATAKHWISNMSPASAARIKRKNKASPSLRNLEANNESSLADDDDEASHFNACFTARDTGVAAEVLKQFQGRLGLDRCLLIRSHLYLDTPHLEEFIALLEKRVSKRVVEQGGSGIDRKGSVPGGPKKAWAAPMPEAGETKKDVEFARGGVGANKEQQSAQLVFSLEESSVPDDVSI